MDNPDLLPGLELVLGHHVLVVSFVIPIPGKPGQETLLIEFDQNHCDLLMGLVTLYLSINFDLIDQA